MLVAGPQGGSPGLTRIEKDDDACGRLRESRLEIGPAERGFKIAIVSVRAHKKQIAAFGDAMSRETEHQRVGGRRLSNLFPDGAENRAGCRRLSGQAADGGCEVPLVVAIKRAG